MFETNGGSDFFLIGKRSRELFVIPHAAHWRFSRLVTGCHGRHGNIGKYMLKLVD